MRTSQSFANMCFGVVHRGQFLTISWKSRQADGGLADSVNMGIRS